MPIIHDDNVLRGPGVYDMKAGLVEMLFAIQAIRELELPVAVTPVCFINSDEEIGSRESGRYIHKLAKLADRCMVLEPSLVWMAKLRPLARELVDSSSRLKAGRRMPASTPLPGPAPFWNCLM